jgi:hypothetical protein
MGDTQLWAGLSQLSTIHYINMSLATHNVLKESASQSKDIIKRTRFSFSGTELCLYLAEKYDMPKEFCEQLKMKYWRKGLRVAFYEMDTQLSEKAKFNIKNLTLIEKILYHGARNKVVNILTRPIVLARNKIKKEYTLKYHF